MLGWRRKREDDAQAAPAEARLRQKYAGFRTLLSANNECLELMAGMQDDLRYVAPLREVFSDRVNTILKKARAVVESLEMLTGLPQRPLLHAPGLQLREDTLHLAPRAVQDDDAPACIFLVPGR